MVLPRPRHGGRLKDLLGGPGPQPVPGEWTHLVGVYDKDEATAAQAGPTGVMRMYVNGTLVSGDVQERPTTWNATGSLQIGRALEPAGYTAHLKGTIADVQVFDRVVTAEETQSLGGVPPLQLAYWDADEAVAGQVPDRVGGSGLTLAGDASVYQPDDTCEPTDPSCVPAAQPLWGDGHLAFPGKDGYASRPPGLLQPKASFTLAVRARLSAPDARTDQAVITLPGTKGQAARVRYDAGSKRWQLVLTAKDATNAAETRVEATGTTPSSEGVGDHLALAYNALFGEVRLYVNGRWTGQAVPWTHSWDLSTTGLQVGRTGLAANGSEYFSGAIDEVRVFAGALDEPLVARISGLTSGRSAS
ncbi:LamG-like jellyroll fold domain-containing protein [Streptomyces sp. G45]|uniref:LamG domain-containing protein n=1 Tax=Streptomyces sp. G45 TaxID=3406627 RepID=UPI003C24ED25